MARLLSILLVLISCSACVRWFPDAKITPRTLTQNERFLALNFVTSFADWTPAWPVPANRLHVPRKARVYLGGTAQEEFKDEIEFALDFVSHATAITIDDTLDGDEDVYLSVYAIDENSTNREELVVQRTNDINQYFHLKVGEHYYLESVLGNFEVVDEFTPYDPTDYINMARIFSTWVGCLALFNGDQLNRDESERPEWNFGIGTVLFSNDKMADVDKSEFLKTCILEEFLHALYYWRDLPNAITQGMFSNPIGDSNEGAESLEAGLAQRKEDLVEIHALLDLYNLPGIRDGLTYNETAAILLHHNPEGGEIDPAGRPENQ